MSMTHRVGAEFLGLFWLVLGSRALAQLWLFWVAPLAGAVIGGLAYAWLGGAVKLGDVASPRAAAE